MEDIIEVRSDERFDENKLAEYLSDKIEGATKNLVVRQFSGGAANLTYELKYPNYTYVLRRPPLGKVAKSAHDMSREHKVLSVLHKSFKYAPISYHFCDDPSIIGSQFFIMERKYGTVIRKTIPEIYKDKGAFGEQTSKALVDALVEFHKVNYKSIGLEDLGKPEGFINRQIEGWYKRWQGSKVKENNDMETVYNWLVKNQPEEYPLSIVHNDYKLDNVMLDNSDPGKLVAIFDWDMTTLGTPLSDLGAMLTYWTEESDSPYFRKTAMMPTEDIGFFTRDQLIQRYTQKSGISVDNINFYHALGLFRLTVIVAQIYYRYYNKQTQDQRFEAFGQMIPLIAKNAYEIAFNS